MLKSMFSSLIARLNSLSALNDAMSRFSSGANCSFTVCVLELLCSTSCPVIMHVSRSTWYREVNIFRIFMIFVSWIKGQEEYCLSPARILISKYQSIVDNRVNIECTSNVVDVMEYSTLKQYIVLQCRISEIMSRMSLKSTEVNNCSRIIRAVLISSFGPPPAAKQDFQRSSDQCCTCEE